jgi:dienelactone hydrolase
MKKFLSLILMLLCSSGSAWAAIKTETIEYKLGDVTMEGYLAYDDSSSAKRPGIVVVHDWMGMGPMPQRRAQMLAELGYVAFAVDIYGKDVRPKNQDEASQQATLYKSDRALLRARALAGLDVLKNNPLVDTNQLVAIGYCFGGTTALELARSGADLKAVVSFHGGLSTPTPDDAKNIKAKILALHGADDPYVPTAEVEAFQKEMRDANVDWQMVSYGGAVHAFTVPEAGNDNSKGAAYNEKADKRSWEAMKQFFAETLK